MEGKAMNLTSTALLAAALVGGGYWWGHTATNNAWQAQQARAQKQASAELAQANARADAAAGNYLKEHLDQNDRYAVLDAQYVQLLQRTPLVVYRTRSTHPCMGATQTDERDAPGHPLDDSPRLTLAAVRVWNGALTGTDSPAGTCGTVGGAEEAQAACSQDSGLTLEDAWANHRDNAKSCAEDRQRFQHLIDFLQSKP